MLTIHPAVLQTLQSGYIEPEAANKVDEDGTSIGQVEHEQHANVEEPDCPGAVMAGQRRKHQRLHTHNSASGPLSSICILEAC